MLDKILAYLVIVSILALMGIYIYYMNICIKVEYKKLENLKNEK